MQYSESGHPLFSSASASCSKILNVTFIFNTMKNFRASTSCSKLLNVKSIFNTVNKFRATLFFQGNASCSKIVNGEKFFNTMYIHLGAIRVIWPSVVCNLDQSRDWL